MFLGLIGQKIRQAEAWGKIGECRHASSVDARDTGSDKSLYSSAKPARFWGTERGCSPPDGDDEDGVRPPCAVWPDTGDRPVAPQPPDRRSAAVPGPLSVRFHTGLSAG